jgi:uncharacterized protein (DUF111 family)
LILKLILDPATGLAGDMLVAALLDAGSKLEGLGDLRRAVGKVMLFAGGLLGKAEMRALPARQGKTEGTRLSIRLEKNERSVSAGLIRQLLEKVSREFSFTASEKDFAERALDILCLAEERAHRSLNGEQAGHSHQSGDEGRLGEPHLHEAQDILLDIAGCARSLRLLEVDFHDTVCLSPVRYGGGMVSFSHGTFTVPAPAVREIIHAYGIPIEAGPVAKELLTPTGASLLAALQPRFVSRESDDVGQGSAGVTGIGFGNLQFEDSAGGVNGLTVHLKSE